MNCQASDYATSAAHPGCGDGKCAAAGAGAGTKPTPAADLGLVLKISF